VSTLLPVATARGSMRAERWGDAGPGLAHPGTLKVLPTGKATRLVFDLSALPRGSTVHHASLYCFASGRTQPRQPVRILVVEAVAGGGKATFGPRPLKLQGPYYRSFDASEAVRRWAGDPKANLGLAVTQFDGFEAARTFLEVRYEPPGAAAAPTDLPAQVTGLRAVHRDGQTFLVWKELPLFRPEPSKVFWVGQLAGRDSKRADGPGEGFAGQRRLPAVTLKTLRDLKGLNVRGKKGPRSMQPLRVVRKLPLIRYRVYRAAAPITARTIKDAQLVGEAEPCCALIERMLSIITHGEYYDPYEDPESVIPTWRLADGKAVMPGEAFYAHTPRSAGRSYYAVCVMQDGKENVAGFAAGNSLAQPIAETPATPQPVLQYVTPNRRNRAGLEYHHAYWLAPPVANVASQDPLRVIVGRMPDDKAPFGLVVRPSASGMFFGGGVTKGSIHLTIEQDIAYGADLGYSNGRGTLRSFDQSKVDFFSDRYIMANIRWAMGKWQIDPARITCSASPPFAIRHGEMLRNLFLGPFELDMDRKWNPGSGSLAGLFGPADSATTVDGQRAWDAVDITAALRSDPGRDIPFTACFFTQPKDGNHGAEYGWQDDPKGLAALRDARQPFLMQWGGASVDREVADTLRSMRWDRSVPAFSNCSADNNPGNGDPDDGDPWGQINGYLLWDYQTVAETKDRWEMTVYLVGAAPDQTCTPGGKAIASGTVVADKWGLVTIRGLTVTKARNRVTIAR